MVVRVSRVGEERTRGSGYLVSPGWVLTACHVVRGATSIGVWLGAPSMLAPEAGAGVDPGRVLMMPDADLALLPVVGQANDPADEPALFGRLDRAPGPAVPVAAAGCPRFKLRPAPDRPGVLLRELDYAIGSIAPLSDAKTGMYEFTVEAAPGPDPEPDKHSPWEGMSGAAVWAGGMLIGVVGQHHLGEGLARLTIRPIEQLFGCASEDQLQPWRAALIQLPAAAGDLRLASPPTARSIQVARARRAVEALAPKVLIGRGDELAALGELAGSETQWRWIQGDAFAGKTALLAWFALHPPDHVDLATCFLRRTTGDNTADYSLDVLTRQLALLAGRRGYLPPQFLSERANDLIDLIDEAAATSHGRSNRLVILIDGLDEYDPVASMDLTSWLPDASTLPDTAILLAASRTGSDVAVPLMHPLRRHVQRIKASEAAAGIRDAAHAELKEARGAPVGFVFPLVCCLAVAGSGLTASQLCALVRRRGRDADVSEIEEILGGSLGRSLVRLPDSADGGTQVYAFAHDTLLNEARAMFAADLPTYEDLLDAWASEYAEGNWPIATPQYLLTAYTRELARRAGDPATPDSRCREAINQLFKVVAHRSRSLRLIELTGNPAVLDQEIRGAQRAIVDTQARSGLDSDEVIFRLAVLALIRQPLTGPRAGYVRTVAAVWARIGRINASVDLAAGIDDLPERARALCTVAWALTQAGKPEQAAEAASRAVQAASDIGDPIVRAKALNWAARALAEAGQSGQAAEAAGQALQAAVSISDPSRRAEALKWAARALAEAGQSGQAAEAAGQALQAAAAIENEGPRAQALSWAALALSEAVRGLARAGQFDQAVQAASDIGDPIVRAEALTGAAWAMAKAGQPEQAAEAAGQALQAAAAIKDEERRAKTLSGAVRGLARAGQSAQAVQAASEIGDPIVQAEALTGAAWALVHAGQSEQAAEVAGRAVQAASGIGDPIVRANELTGAARALAEAGQSGQAAEVAGQALHAAAAIEDKEPQARALTRAAWVLAEAGQSGQAAEVAGQALHAAAAIEDKEPRARALTRVAWALVHAGQSEQAAGVAGQVVQAAAAITDPLGQSKALSGAADVLTEAGQSEQAAEVTGKALQAAAAIEGAGLRAKVLSEMAWALVQAGQSEQAAEVAGQALQAVITIVDPSPRAEALIGAAWALVQAGQSEQAAEVAGQAVQAAAAITDPLKRLKALSGAADVLTEAGQTEQAAAIARQVVKTVVAIADVKQVSVRVISHSQPAKADVLSAAARVLAQVGQSAQALQAVVSISGVLLRMKALTGVAQVLAEAGQSEQVADVALRALEAAAAIKHASSRADALSWVARALAEAGQSEQAADAAGQAVQAAAAINEDALAVITLTRVAQVLAEAGQSEQAADVALRALGVAAAIENAVPRTYSLAWLVPVLTETGQSDQAAGAASQAVHDAAAIEYAWGRANRLAQVARALAQAGRSEQAAGAASQAVHDAAAISDLRGRTEVLTAAAQALVHAGQSEQAAGAASQAVQAAGNIDEWPLRVRTLSEVARELADAGLPAQAFQAAAAIDDPTQQALALAFLLARPVGQINSGHEAHRRALQQLLLNPGAPDHLAVFPAALLSRLVANGYLVPSGRQ
jgi:tetratricopeptide (TPR) repeat protein